ncbi:hypothetical protein [Catenuloplanes indicus]
MSDRTAVIPRQDDPATPAPDLDATQAINTGRGLYQSGSVAPSGKLAPLATDGPGTGTTYRPGRSGGEPAGAEPTQPVPPPDAVRRDEN